MTEQTGGANKNELPTLVRALFLLSTLFGLSADGCVDFVGWGRKGGAGAEQSFGSERGIGIGVDLGLEVDGGAAAGIEAANRDHDFVAHLGRDTIG